MHSCLRHLLDLKNCRFSTLIFPKGMLECLEEMLTKPKWKLKVNGEVSCYGIQKVLHLNLVLYEI
jgi:hypothetical protein